MASHRNRRRSGARRPFAGGGRAGPLRRRRRRRGAPAGRLWLAVPVLVVALGLAAALSSRPAGPPRLFLGVDHQRSFRNAIDGGLPAAVSDALELCIRASCDLSADGLTADTVASASLPVRGVLAVPDGVAEGAARERVIDELAQRRADELLADLPTDPDGTCTDVIGGFLLAESALRSAPGDGARNILMLTDGVSNCGRWDVLAATTTEQATETFLAELDRNDMIPDLTDVEVRIAGGARSADTSPGGAAGGDPARGEQLQRFWRLYLQRAGANLPVDWWSPRVPDTSLAGVS